jgi:hypothetical protein
VKTKHNKKRNTGFVFEVLVREMTKSVLEDDKSTQREISTILKEHFTANTELSKELDCYRTLQVSRSLERSAAIRLLDQTRQRFQGLDRQKVFEEQNSVISRVNQALSARVFDNHIPNYRELATISQLLNDDTSLQQKLVFEGQIIDTLTKKGGSHEEKHKEIDEVVIRSFMKRFDSSYESFLPEQKSLLRQYILQFVDDGAEFSLFINEELRRIKKEVESSVELKEVKEDKDMITATSSVLALLDSFRNTPIDESSLKKVLKLQHLVSEYKR